MGNSVDPVPLNQERLAADREVVVIIVCASVDERLAVGISALVGVLFAVLVDVPIEELLTPLRNGVSRGLFDLVNHRAYRRLSAKIAVRTLREIGADEAVGRRMSGVEVRIIRHRRELHDLAISSAIGGVPGAVAETFR